MPPSVHGTWALVRCGHAVAGASRKRASFDAAVAALAERIAARAA